MISMLRLSIGSLFASKTVQSISLDDLTNHRRSKKGSSDDNNDGIDDWISASLDAYDKEIISGVILEMASYDQEFKSPKTEIEVDSDGNRRTVSSYSLDEDGSQEYKIYHDDWPMKWANYKRTRFLNDDRLHGMFGQNRFTEPSVFVIPKNRDEALINIDDDSYWKSLPMEYIAELAAPIMSDIPEFAFEALMRCIYGHRWDRTISELPIPTSDVKATDIRCYGLIGDLIYAGVPKGHTPSLDESDWLIGLAWWMYGGQEGDVDSMYSAATFFDLGYEALVRLFPLSKNEWNDQENISFLKTLSNQDFSPDILRDTLLNQNNNIDSRVTADASTYPNILYGAAALKGHVGANLALGDKYHRGINVEANCNSSADYYIPGARYAHEHFLFGFPFARNSKWDLSAKNGDRMIHSLKEIDQLIQMYEDTEDIQYASILASRYLLGSHGFPQDFIEAIYYINTVITQGETLLQRDDSGYSTKTLKNHVGRSYGILGYMELYGILGPPAVDVALQRFMIAWNSYNSPLGAVGLGLMYHYGIIDGEMQNDLNLPLKDAETQDKSNVYKLFKIASDAGYQDGQFSLAIMLMEEGKNAEAFELIGKAIAKGHASAAFAMGMIHLRGSIVTTDCQLAVSFLSQSARLQQWGLSNQQRVTRLWQLVKAEEEIQLWDFSSPKERVIDILDRWYNNKHSIDVRSSKKLMALWTSRIANAGYDEARIVLLSWLQGKSYDILSMNKVQDPRAQRRYIARVRLRILEQMNQRTPSVYQEIGDLYRSHLAPIASVYTTDVDFWTNEDGEDMSGWLTIGLPLMADRTDDIEKKETTSFSSAIGELMKVSEKWLKEDEGGDEANVNAETKVNFSLPFRMEPHLWWDFSIARAYYRSARDSQHGSTAIDMAKASFSMGTMALLGEGGPVDYKLASTHFKTMRIYDPSSSRVQFALESILIPALRVLKLARLDIRWSDYLRSSCIICCGILGLSSLRIIRKVVEKDVIKEE